MITSNNQNGLFYYTKADVLEMGMEKYKELPLLKKALYNKNNEEHMLKLGTESILDHIVMSNNLVNVYNKEQAKKKHQKTFTTYSTKITTKNIINSVKEKGYFNVGRHPIEALMEQGVSMEYLKNLFLKYVEQHIRSKDDRDRKQFFEDMEMGMLDD